MGGVDLGGGATSTLFYHAFRCFSRPNFASCDGPYYEQPCSDVWNANPKLVLLTWPRSGTSEPDSEIAASSSSEAR